MCCDYIHSGSCGNFLPGFRLSAAYQNAYQQQEKRRLKRDSGEVEDDIETGNSTIDYSGKL